MLDPKVATRELVVAAGSSLRFGLSEEEIGILVSVTQPLFGQEIFAAGQEEVEAVLLPENLNDLASWSTIRDSRYLHGSVQINLIAGTKNKTAERKRELQIVLALIFHAIRAK